MNDAYKTKIKTISKWLGNGSINLFGMPLSGKDTQCMILTKFLNAKSFGGGDILRSSELSVSNKKLLDDGYLVPQKTYLSLMLPYFSREEFKNYPLVLSVVGRWHGEEKVVLAAANKSKHPIKAVVYLKLNSGSVLKRLELSDRQRPEDEKSKIDTRLKEFKNKTLPVLAEYAKLGLLVEVDADQKIENVTKDILEKLYRIARTQLQAKLD